MKFNIKTLSISFLILIASNLNATETNDHDFTDPMQHVAATPLTPQLPDVELLDSTIVELACLAAPECIKTLIRKLSAYPQAIPKKRQYLFVGPAGAGKTTLAQAVAQKAGWPCIVVRIPELANEFQNSAAASLKRIIDTVIDSKYKCIIVLDELTHITDNYKKAQNGNNDAAAAVWSLLDRCKQYENIIVIATTNDISDLPAQMKSRFNKSGIIEIPLPDYTARGYLLCYLLGDFITTKSSYDVGSYIRSITRKTEGKSFRDIIDLCEEVIDKAESKGRAVHREDIDAVIKTWRSKWHPTEIYRSCKSSAQSMIKASPPYIIPAAGLALSLYHTFLQESWIMNKFRMELINISNNINPTAASLELPTVTLPALAPQIIATQSPTKSTWSSIVSAPASAVGWLMRATGLTK